jgi:3-methyladenine DNA glycosylase Tag
MTPFARLWQAAVDRMGGHAAVESQLQRPLAPDALRATPDHVWLSDMGRRVFEAGHGAQAVAERWEAFETALDGFDPVRCAELTDPQLAWLADDPRLIADPDAMATIRENARFLRALVEETGEAAAHRFADWPGHDFIGLLDLLARRGAGLGGLTGQYLLRGRGVDGFILSDHVTRALIREGVVAHPPASRPDMTAVQTAFDLWRSESGRPMMQISKVLALTEAPPAAARA